MVAIALIFGRLTADDYEDEVAADPRVDRLRELMTVEENSRFSIDYLDPDKRSIGNAVQVFFMDGESSDRVEVEYPVGHRRRREEGIPLLLEKFEGSLRGHFEARQAGTILEACRDREQLGRMPVDDFISLWIK
jgi:2-methylcitrate dehydratase